MECMKKQAQSLIEYGLILALVAVIAVTILGKFGKSITSVGDKASSNVTVAGDKAADNYCDSITPGSTFDTTTGKCTAGTGTGTGTGTGN